MDKNDISKSENDVKQAKSVLYIEDSLDLEKFKKETIKKRRERFLKKHAFLLNCISVLIVVLSFIIAIQGFDIANYYIEKYRTSKISKQAALIRDSVDDDDNNNEAEIAEEITAGIPTPEVYEIETEEPNDIYPEEIEPPPINSVFVRLREEFGNDDIVADLLIEDTNIRYPVVQTDNNEFYLTHDLNKQENVDGSIFMDYENTLYPLSKNTIIYGHNMKNETMFHNIRYYANKDFYESHKYISLKTIYEDTKWEVFAFYVTTTDFDYIKADFRDERSFSEFLEEIKNRAAYDTNVSISADDFILTLSTCTSANDNERYVLHAIKTEQ